MSPKVDIIIVNWNGWQDSIECLESVFHLDYDNFKVTLCDNQSSDNSIKHIKTWAEGKHKIKLPLSNGLNFLITPAISKPIQYQQLERGQAESKPITKQPPLTLIQTGENLGFAGANNVGMRFAMQNNCDFIWLLNNDTVVDPSSLRHMVEHSLQYGQANTCGSLLLHYHQPDCIQALGGNRYNKWTALSSTSLGRGLSIEDKIDHHFYEQQLSYISGASWLLPKQFVKDIGLMDESYFLYCEEIDWCARNNNQYKLTYAPKAKVYHKEGGSIGSPNLEKTSSLFSDYYIFRNKLKFTRKFFPEAIVTAYLTSLFQAFNRARRGQWDKAWLIFKILLGLECKMTKPNIRS